MPPRRAAILLALLVAACGRTAREAPAELRAGPLAPAPRLDWPVPDFVFTDQDGQAFGREHLQGHPWVAAFVFTTCHGPCPAMTRNMKALHDEFADFGDLRFVTFTVDPAHDTAEVLSRYAREHGADTRRWKFLRGTPSGLRELTAALKLGDPAEPVHHSTRFLLVDASCRVRATYLGTDEDDRARLREDLRRMVADAAR
jgi:protein SCO1/2